MKYTPWPWRFDGHGINSREGERICKVTNSERCLENGRDYNQRFLDDSMLISRAPELLKMLKFALDNLKMAKVWADEAGKVTSLDSAIQQIEDLLYDLGEKTNEDQATEDFITATADHLYGPKEEKNG
jgi:hypothetical protein